MAGYFADIAPVTYKGPDSDDELAYRWYDKNRVVLGKTMEEHLRFAVCFWHTFCWPGSDVFGAGTFGRPWHAGANDNSAAAMKRAAAFDFFTRLDLPFYCFHDVDVMGEAQGVAQHRRNFAEAVADLERLQRPQAAVGHREPVQPSSLCRGRRDQPGSGGVRLRRDAGARRARSDASPGRRQLCAVGRPRRL